ncbi:MAG: hypothetical protein NWE78_03875 [Candidatus Bathyarchaeota archaeon]|nr:hypothetical protein [Candidatus Bathyarchaeota archaeon]
MLETSKKKKEEDWNEEEKAYLRTADEDWKIMAKKKGKKGKSKGKKGNQ